METPGLPFGFSIRPCYLDTVIYEWDPAKAKANRRKHGVSFEEGATVFLDPLAITFPDPDHSDEEDREITIGLTTKNRVVFVSHCKRGIRTRIINARKATRKERKQYEEGLYQ
ncbi:MAG TPA: BrnT family toxin [Candidatus Binatia bacterium]